ncbi:MAG: hypothetical protein PVG09_07225, partial [Thiohalocapsa sp.]
MKRSLDHGFAVHDSVETISYASIEECTYISALSIRSVYPSDERYNGKPAFFGRKATTVAVWDAVTQATGQRGQA